MPLNLAMENPIVRRAVIADAEHVYEMLCCLSDKQHDKERFMQCFERNLRNDTVIYLVAEIDNKPCGFISCHSQQLLHHTGTAYEIQEMYIKESNRGWGIGKKLIATLRLMISETDYDVFEVTSSKWREEAHAFYLNNGFVQTHKKFTSKGNYSSC